MARWRVTNYDVWRVPVFICRSYKLPRMACSSVYDHSGCTEHRDRRSMRPENLDSVATLLFEAVEGTIRRNVSLLLSSPSQNASPPSLSAAARRRRGGNGARQLIPGQDDHFQRRPLAQLGQRAVQFVSDAHDGPEVSHVAHR
jgi:hypothetical protein